MRRLLTVALGLCLGATLAAAQGTPSNPVQVLEARGDTWDTPQVSCTTAGTVRAFPNSGNLLSAVLKNTDGSNTVYICDASPCDTTGFPIAPGETLTLDRSVRGVDAYCDGQSSTVVLATILEYR